MRESRAASSDPRDATLVRMITILGTGLLGTGFAQALRKRGESIRVWNRSPEKARALAEIGATRGYWRDRRVTSGCGAGPTFG